MAGVQVVAIKEVGGTCDLLVALGGVNVQGQMVHGVEWMGAEAELSGIGGNVDSMNHV